MLKNRIGIASGLLCGVDSGNSDEIDLTFRSRIARAWCHLYHNSVILASCFCWSTGSWTHSILTLEALRHLRKFWYCFPAHRECMESQWNSGSSTQAHLCYGPFSIFKRLMSFLNIDILPNFCVSRDSNSMSWSLTQLKIDKFLPWSFAAGRGIALRKRADGCKIETLDCANTRKWLKFYPEHKRK